jgi:hypothetical protein
VADDDTIEIGAVEKRRRRVLRGATILVLAGALLTDAVVSTQRATQLERQIRVLEKDDDTEQILDRLATILAISQDVAPGTVLGTALVTAPHLTEAGRVVTAELQEALAAATVQLGEQPRGSSFSGWNAGCTGTLVTEGDLTFILTAAHCFDRDLVIDDVDYEEGRSDVREVSRRLPSDYAVLQGSAPVVALDRVVLPVDHTFDWALASLAGPVPPGVGTVPLTLFRIDGQEGTGGDVAQHTYSSRTAGRAIESTGIYLGAADDHIGSYVQRIDLVAIEPAGADVDACFYGASGSSAALANGRITGPLSVRNTIGYGKDRALDGEDTDGRWGRLQLEDATGVDLADTTVICGYSRYDEQIVDQLLDQLR